MKSAPFHILLSSKGRLQFHQLQLVRGVIIFLQLFSESRRAKTEDDVEVASEKIMEKHEGCQLNLIIKAK
jgi:hypothetical protein